MNSKRGILLFVIIMVAAMWLLKITSIANERNLDKETSVDNSSLQNHSNILSTTSTQQTFNESIIPVAEASRKIIVQRMVKKTTEPKETIEEIPTKSALAEEAIEKNTWNGSVLNSYVGTVEGPSGKETYYNLDMSNVVSIMEDLGYTYEYSVREDGVKMFGPYVMCAANLELRPKGTILETSLGTAIVCDTGDFALKNPTQLDIAVDW